MKMKILSISEINNYIKRLLVSDPILYNIYVEGEISNCKIHSSGHIYFTLKDKTSRISCIMFKSNSNMLKFIPQDGMQVIVKGYVSVYERDGLYQLYVDDMNSAGMGDLYIAFQQLKTSLEKEGFFDLENKKQLPFIPEKIGIITSPTGAAIRDIISVIRRRFPKVELYIFPVTVQGDHASTSIKKAIELCNNSEKDIDVIILGRGGGSIEELWAFNEKIVAEAILNSNIPIISAIGHETDFTISDFVADVRAHTPSAAAELVVPKLSNIIERLNDYRKRLLFAIDMNISQNKKSLDIIRNNYYFKRPLNYIYEQKQYLDSMYKNLTKIIKQNLLQEKEGLTNTVGLLNSLNPLSIFSRGYAVAIDDKKNTIKSIADVEKDDIVKICLIDGTITTRVINSTKEDKSLE